MPSSVASGLGLHCLPIILLGVSRLQWVNPLNDSKWHSSEFKKKQSKKKKIIIIKKFGIQSAAVVTAALRVMMDGLQIYMYRSNA